LVAQATVEEKCGATAEGILMLHNKAGFFDFRLPVLLFPLVDVLKHVQMLVHDRKSYFLLQVCTVVLLLDVGSQQSLDIWVL
jgi:hypothetical protein